MMKKLITNLGRKNKLFVLLLFFICQLFSTEIYAQTVSIQGRVSTSRLVVKYASVTFIDNADTTNKFSALTDASGNYQIDLTITSVEPGNNLPAKFELEQNYPNPFSSSTAIPYQIKEEADVHVTIYDILGRVVKKINVGQQFVGLHHVLWDGSNNFGQKVASGVYFYKLSTGDESQVKKMIFNQNGDGFVSLPHSYSSKENSYPTQANKTQSVQENTFTIRVENTSTILPAIVPLELQNVVIQNDTTINLSVDYLPTTTIDFDSLHQIIRGFGGANILLWRPDMTDSEIQTAFGTGDGQLGFTILRVMLEADSTRWGLYVSSAKKAYEIGAIIIAVPWFAPAELVEVVDGNPRVRYDKYDEYAAHLDSFGKFMASNGVPIYGVSLQNELDIGEWTHWSADEMFTFVRDYAQAIEGPKVMGPESYKFDRAYSDPILNDSVACANLDIVSGHIYGGGIGKYPLAEEKGKEVWMTEYLINSGNPPTNLNIDTGWTGAIMTAENINNCMSADMSTYVYWYIVRYYGPIADGTYATKGGVTKKGYVMSQFARFVRPGFYRVENSVSPPTGAVNNEVDVTAYKDPASSKVVIVAINSGSTQAETVFRLSNGAMTTTFTPYTTSEFKNCQQGEAFEVTGDNFTFTLEPSSITTFVSN